MTTQNELPDNDTPEGVEEAKPKRKRIYQNPPSAATPVLIDTPFYCSNLSCNEAKHIGSSKAQYEAEIWFNKHYFDRYIQGDNDGTKRHGIEPEAIKNIVRRSLPHLILYSNMVRDFKFVNYSGQVESPVKVVLKEVQEDGGTLNVVIQTHFVSLTKFQITVVTARCGDDFKMGLGQYAIELQEDTSVLFRLVNGSLKEIFKF